MPDYTPEQFRAAVIEPLKDILKSYIRGANRMKRFIDSGLIKPEGLPLKTGMTLRALPDLRKLKRNLFNMLGEAEDRTLQRTIEKRADSLQRKRRNSGPTKRKK